MRPEATACAVYSCVWARHQICNCMMCMKKLLGLALVGGCAWCAGDGGAHKHYGPTYIGLQPPPVALCLNLFNIDYRQPQNKWAQNPTACQRLYDESLAIINSKAPNKITPIESIAKQSA